MFTNPDHITLAVADPEAAIEFFAILGFRRGPVKQVDGGRVGEFMGLADMRARHITLTLERADPPFEIQLLAFDPPPDAAQDPGPTHHRRHGFNHLALAVDDIEATTAHLQANGVAMLNDEMDYIGRRLRFFEGPEGITLEMVERTD